MLVEAGVTVGLRNQWRYGTHELSEPSLLCWHNRGIWTDQRTSAAINHP